MTEQPPSENGQHPPEEDASREGCGWSGDFPTFGSERPRRIREMLFEFLPDAEPEQVKAWDESIPPIQSEVSKTVDREPKARGYSALLEYRLPYESRRPDIILLVTGAVVVVELKGRHDATQAHLDQVSAYARDLANYHSQCEDKPVHAVLVPTQARGYQRQECGVHVTGPDGLDALIASLDRPHLDPPLKPITVDEFLAPESYRPLPTIVAAARHLLRHRALPRIKRASACTDPAVDAIIRVCHEAAATKSRRLVLLSGVPGSGKTLVGLRVAHSEVLDELAVERSHGKPAAPAVYLSGNGPLVQVLQYELSSESVSGKTFVRGVKDYVRTYSSRRSPIPPEHVLIYDEAQRAWDEEQVRRKHKEGDLSRVASEPELFIEFAERVPEWCVVLALIGGGQEIHVGEEGGIGQWAKAIRESPRCAEWAVSGPEHLAKPFTELPYQSDSSLHLTAVLRAHRADVLDQVVKAIVDGPAPPQVVAPLVEKLEEARFALRLTRDLGVAKRYVRERYGEQADARYGLLVSARVREPERYGIQPKPPYYELARWFADGDESSFSGRNLTIAPSEFDVQGLELDAAILAWGEDFILDRGADGHWEWSNAHAKRYVKRAAPESPLSLRRNAYRVLMTRGRDGLVIWVPPDPILDATYEYFAAVGMKELR